MFVIPIPRLGINRLPNASQHPQTREIVILYMVCAQTPKQADRGRGGIELGELVLFDSLPVTGGRGIHRGALEHGGGNSVGERAINDVGVSRDPSDVRHAGKAVVWVHVEYVFHG
jgi:hypothetical protein